MFRHLKSLDEASDAFRRQRDAIIERCLPLADHIAWRYRGRGQPHDDLVQAARVGLIGAVDRFDADNGAEFVSFAVPTMMGEVRRHFRDYGWAVHVPRRVKDVQPQLNKARADLSQKLRRAPNASEIAEHLGIERQRVVDATIAGSPLLHTVNRRASRTRRPIPAGRKHFGRCRSRTGKGARHRNGTSPDSRTAGPTTHRPYPSILRKHDSNPNRRTHGLLADARLAPTRQSTRHTAEPGSPTGPRCDRVTATKSSSATGLGVGHGGGGAQAGTVEPATPRTNWPTRSVTHTPTRAARS